MYTPAKKENYSTSVNFCKIGNNKKILIKFIVTYEGIIQLDIALYCTWFMAFISFTVGEIDI